MAGGSSLASRRHGGHHLLHGGFGDALLGIALHLAVTAASAADAGTARGLDLLAHAVGTAVDQAAGVLHRLAVRVVEEVGRQGCAGGGRARGDVQHGGHGHWALVARAAEAGDGLLVAAGDWRRARLLQTDDVAAEAEAEVAGIVTWNLLGGHV